MNTEGGFLLGFYLTSQLSSCQCTCQWYNPVMPKQDKNDQKRDFFRLLDKAATTDFRKAKKKSSRSSGLNTSKRTHPNKIASASRKRSGKSRAKTS